MSRRGRYSIVISGLFVVIGFLVMWIGHYLLLRNFGLILWICGVIYMTITMLRSFSRRNR